MRFIFLLKKDRKVLLPKEIIIETTNVCNIRCLHCHFHGVGASRKRALGFMSGETWKAIFADISSWVSETEGVNICLHGAGEPLLHPEFEEILKEARKVPKASIGFMTNCMLFNGKWHEIVVELPVDWIWFSVDGVKAETNDRYRKGASLKVIEQNIESLIELKEKRKATKPVLNFNMVRYPDVTAEEVIDYVSKWIPHAEVVSIATFRPIGSKRLLTEDQRKNIPHRPCPLLYSQLVVSWNGRVGLCCEDINIEVSPGTFGSKTLIELFNSPLFNKIRKLHERNKRHKVPICKECDVWAADIALVRRTETIRGVKVEVTETPAATIYRKKV